MQTQNKTSFFIIYEMLNGLNDISRSVLYSIWMYFSYVRFVLYRADKTCQIWLWEIARDPVLRIAL